MALFGISGAEAQAIAEGTLRGHEKYRHDSWSETRCPLCDAHVRNRERQEPAAFRKFLAACVCPGLGDETLTYCCGSQRIRRDGKRKFIAKCLVVKGGK